MRYNVIMFEFSRHQCKNSLIYRPAFALLFFLLALIPLNADSFADNFHWSISGSLFYFAADNGVDSDPAAILPTFGFSLAWQFWGPLRLEFTEDIYFTNYEYNAALDYPMACNPENRSAFVMGFLTGIQLTVNIPINENGSAFRVYIGPAADLRLAVPAFGLNHPDDIEDARLQTEAIFNYFWSKGRWFMPVFGIGIDFPVNEKLKLGFDLRAWFPVYKFWTDDKTPAIDGWRFGAGLRITPRKTS